MQTPLVRAVVRVKVVAAAAGDDIAEGATVVVMEAMKMEHTLRAPRAGNIEKLPVSVGDQVDEGDLLFSLQPQEE